eukprot:GFUD01026140.1.p1 GENE.GFUD01026140.1~~GFUD01026140.1.p1  ORF type:complete len:332 (-),score=52.90 GFUD01026140.1:15-1010(-)
MEVLLVVVLTMVFAPHAVAPGFSLKGKSRMLLKSLLYDYTHSKIQSMPVKQLDLQCGPSNGKICCSRNFTVEDGDCEYDTEDLFKNAKKALTFQMNQLDTFDTKFLRLKKSMKLIGNKMVKQNDFRNTSELLLRALGGDKASPQCQSTQTKSLRDAVTTLEELGNCSASIEQSCAMNETELGINMPAFEVCDINRTEIIKKISVAMNEQDPTAKCYIWREINTMIDDLQKEDVMNGTGKNCFKAMEFASKQTSPNNADGRGLKGRCLKQFIECKQAQDRAIALINACNDEDTIIIGTYRSLLNDLEDDEEDNDYADRYDDDYDSSWLHDFD